MAIKFKELKKYLSRVDKLSICFEDGHYENYVLLSDIQDGIYDELYIFGIGMADVEFPRDVYGEPKDLPRRISLKDGFYIGCGLEIVVHEEPRDIKREKEEVLNFGDLRNYLQIGRNFSIVTKEDWSEECYEWPRDIPEKYNSMYVYGIGLMESIEEIGKVTHPRLLELDSNLNKKMRIVLSESPRE